MEQTQRDLLIEVKADIGHLREEVRELKNEFKGVKKDFVTSDNSKLFRDDIHRRIGALEKMRDWTATTIIGLVIVGIMGVFVFKPTTERTEAKAAMTIEKGKF